MRAKQRQQRMKKIRKRKIKIKLSDLLQIIGFFIVFFLAGPLADMDDLTPFLMVCFAGCGFMAVGGVMEYINGKE